MPRPSSSAARLNIPPVNREGLTTHAIYSTGSHAELIDRIDVGDQTGAYSRDTFNWPFVYELRFPVQRGDVLKVWGQVMVTTERDKLVSALSYLELEDPIGIPIVFADKEGDNFRRGEGHHLRVQRFGVVQVEGDGIAVVTMHLGAFDYGIGGYPHHLDIGADEDVRDRSYGQMIVEVLR